MQNVDKGTVEGFGHEWERFDQSAVPEEELRKIFDAYFSVFPWETLPDGAVGFDLGCGTGRWAKFVAERVGQLHCIDPSTAIEVARRNLAEFDNVCFHHAGVDDIPIEDHSMDFGYSLGVLHHVPDTQAGISACVQKLKPGAPFLVYLYYAFDNRPTWFRRVWKVSDVARGFVSNLPTRQRQWVADVLAAIVYFPLARTSRYLARFDVDTSDIPLSAYRDHSFYTMRTDALDRFGTKLEHRFTANEIERMMVDAGLEKVRVSSGEPYWCVMGFKR